MRSGPSRVAKGRVLLLAAGILLGLTAGIIGSERAEAAVEGKDPDRFVRGGAPGARTIAALLERLWAAGFFRRSEAVLAELLDNEYGFFGPGGPTPPPGSPGWGCYAPKRGGPDTVFLKKDLFAHFEVGMEETAVRVDVGARAMPVLVHELCHDLWMNILDEEERAAFSREGEAFLRDFRRAQTADEIRRFLALAGEDPADRKSFRSYAAIGDILAANPARSMCGHEIFAWLAERLFVAGLAIPKPLSAYYVAILAGTSPVPRRR